MAIGDDAAAAGMDTVPGAVPANTIDTEINKTRDYIAQRTSAVQPVLKGGTGATTAAAARTNLGAFEAAKVMTDGNTAAPNKVPIYNGASQLTAASPTLDGHVATQGWTAAYAPSRAQTQALHDSLYLGNMSPAIFSRTVGGNAVYITSGGLLGHLPSTARLKKDIRDAGIAIAAARSVLIRSYRYRAAAGLGDDRHVGVIAEELEAIGLGWLVGYDTDRRPMTVHYEWIGLVALALAQDDADRIDSLEASVAELRSLVAQISEAR